MKHQPYAPAVHVPYLHDPAQPPRQPWTPWRALRLALRRRRDARKLEALPDYLLDDIGLDRAQIRAAKRGRSI